MNGSKRAGLMRYKLLVVDIDGTLVGRSGDISAENKDAMRIVQRSGIRISLCTGRVPKACERYIRELNLNGYHVYCDGALVSGPEGDVVYIKPVSPKVVREAVEFSYENDVYLELYSATHFFTRGETWATELRREFFGLEPTITDLRELWKSERIVKAQLMLSTDEERLKAQGFQERFKNVFNFSYARIPSRPDIDFINLIHPAASKGTALRALVAHLKISLDDVVAVGDGTNDIPLLSLAGTSIAMGNAPDEVKAIADYVTLDVDQNGLAAAVEKVMVIN
ncbi:MAG: HAD family phosphatase [Chloroflexi bacterium]|nr:HAD family phosphatase [Chloroflexota bacterium]